MSDQENRRDSLKIIGAIGATCLFPFQADELYGQHEAHTASGPDAVYQRTFFNDEEFALLNVLVDEIIPPTSTPGAAAAGVPAYIDYVASKNESLGKTCRDGLKYLKKKKFEKLPAAGRERLLQDLCDSAEKQRKTSSKEKFWVAIKNLTADGYYTSRIGLRDELGFQGGAVLGSYPSCEVPEH
ncbi:transcriptional initiation protein Tat [Bryobacterales bacterium F-183]|nr:transcriptional initiation protein Tat [Bryobacterales bacterium F-183]